LCFAPVINNKLTTSTQGARTEEGIKEFVDQMTQTPVKFMADFSLEKLKELSGSSQIITFVSSFNETSRTGVEFSDQARKHQAGGEQASEL